MDAWSVDHNPCRLVRRLRPALPAVVRLLVVIARAHEYPIAWPRLIDSGLNRAELPRNPLESADEQDVRRRRRRNHGHANQRRNRDRNPTP
jgi:hypothetical protein